MKRLFEFATILILLAIPAFGQDADTAWVRRYGDGLNNFVAQHVALDQNGNVYVAGYADAAGEQECLVIKYSPSGNILWSRTHHHGPYDRVWDLIVDHSGNAIIGCNYFLIIKYDLDGNETVLDSSSGPWPNYAAYSLSNDIDGNIYATGMVQNVSQGNTYYITKKYYASGSLAWMIVRSFSEYTPGEASEAHDVAVDNVGNVYVTGTVTTSNIAPTIATLKYDPAGNELWAQVFSPPFNMSIGPQGVPHQRIAIDSVGNIYVMGNSANNGAYVDYLLIKYYPNGDTAWTRTYDWASNFDWPMDMALDSHGNIYVTGQTIDSWARPFTTIKYKPNGDITWIRSFNYQISSAFALAIDSSDNIYVTGSAGDCATVKYDHEGRPLWVKKHSLPFDDELKDVAVDNNGNAVVTGCSAENPWPTNTFDYLTIKYKPCPCVTSNVPSDNALAVPNAANISVTFDIPMDASSFNDTSIILYGNLTGYHLGNVTYNAVTKTATFNPANDFAKGEVVTAEVMPQVRSSDGTSLGKAHIWSFTTVSERALAIFQAPINYEVGIHPQAIVAADFNGDGNIDIATANYSYIPSSYDISILVNQGNGNFALDSTYAIEATFLATGDFNGDGYIDLATDAGLILLNDGNAIFSPHPFSGYKGCFADFDGNGSIDFACISSALDPFHDTFAAFFNNGNALFPSSSISYPVGNDASSLASVDIDGNHAIDVICANFLSNDVSISLNYGDRSFDCQLFTYPIGTGPACVIAADFNGDSNIDLATANKGSGDISVLLNNGDVTFAPQVTYPTGDSARCIIAADFDGDNDLDLAVANQNSFDITVLLNNGNGSFIVDSFYVVPGKPSAITAADFNGDGKIDIAVANSDINSISILFNRGCTYTPGDANGSGTWTGQDVTYGVRFFKGGNPPPYSCECTPGHTWYVAGDVNGSCSYTGQDVTRMVLHFKLGVAALPCADCPPVVR